MIGEEQQDLASAYVLRKLSAEEERLFEAELATDRELQELVTGLQETAASLALSAPVVVPPAALRARVLESIRTPKESPAMSRSGGNWIPWAIAAALAICTGWLALDRSRLERTIEQVQKRDSLSQVMIASLSAQVNAYEKGAVLVVWDPKRQQGVVKFRGLTPNSGKDYQLWVLDPGTKSPISAGVITPDDAGFARVLFTPTKPVNSADKFAVSVEPAGGSEQPRGEIVFAGPSI